MGLILDYKIHIEPMKKEIVHKMREFVKNNLSSLLSSVQERNSKFSLSTPPSKWNPPFTYIVGDNRFAIWFKDPTDPETYACISSEDRIVADVLSHIYRNNCGQKSLDILCEELGL